MKGYVFDICVILHVDDDSVVTVVVKYLDFKQIKVPLLDPFLVCTKYRNVPWIENVIITCTHCSSTGMLFICENYLKKQKFLMVGLLS